MHALVGTALTLVLFIAMSAYLLYTMEYGDYLYCFLALTTVVNLGAEKRNRQLRILFSQAEYLKARLLENCLVILPFALCLLYAREWLLVLGLLAIAGLLVFYTFVKTNFAVIPTPFGKLPFENIVGFRKSILGVVFLYFLVFKGIQVENFNLAVVSFGVLFLVAMSFHAKPEPVHFVWIFSDTPRRFLSKKVGFSAMCASILALVPLVALGYFFPENFGLSLLVFFVGQLFLLSMIFAKYSAYPNEMNLPQAILYGLSLMFPPIFPFVCILFYRKAKNNLKQIL